MAGRGPAPKDPEKRLGHHGPQQVTELDGGKTKPPRMPRATWSPQTKRWWKTWVNAPQAAQFLATDWERLLMLLPMVEAYFTGNLGLLAEIRLNEAKLGATPEDRLRLRWRLREADKDAERDERAATTKKPSRRRDDPRLRAIEGGKS